MPIFARSSAPPSSRSSTADALQPAQLRWLPPLLSTIAGMVDVIGFLTLGLFTAHVTGNLVVIAALIVRGGPPKLALILAVPVFMIGVAAVWLIAKLSQRRGPALIRPLIMVHFLLLAAVLIFSVSKDPASNRNGWAAVVAAMIAVSAMACQFALLRLAIPGAPSTAVMTGNLTSGVLSLLDTLAKDTLGKDEPPLMPGAKERLEKTLGLVGGFCAGCVAGAAAVSWMGAWAWSLPVVLAGLALACSRSYF
jgi:uncharacterized membrane protein YoaK (UPF0700 family)